MTAYSALAAWYDELTRDVPYAAFADYYERLFAERGGETKLLLDLCCGTGTLACLMAERGYEMIAADASADMLMSAREKASALSAGKMPYSSTRAPRSSTSTARWTRRTPRWTA